MDCLNEAESTRPCRNDRLASRYLLENSQKVGVLVVGWDKEQGLSLYSERSRSSQIGAKSGDSQSLLIASCSSSLPTETRMLGRWEHAPALAELLYVAVGCLGGGLTDETVFWLPISCFLSRLTYDKLYFIVINCIKYLPSPPLKALSRDKSRPEGYLRLPRRFSCRYWHNGWGPNRCRNLRSNGSSAIAYGTLLFIRLKWL